jgi:hypothetical protein
LYDGRSFVSQTARDHLEEDQALVALELARRGHYRPDAETATAAEPAWSFASQKSSELRHRLFIEVLLRKVNCRQSSKGASIFI